MYQFIKSVIAYKRGGGPLQTTANLFDWTKKKELY